MDTGSRKGFGPGPGLPSCLVFVFGGGGGLRDLYDTCLEGGKMLCLAPLPRASRFKNNNLFQGLSPLEVSGTAGAFDAAWNSLLLSRRVGFLVSKQGPSLGLHRVVQFYQQQLLCPLRAPPLVCPYPYNISGAATPKALALYLLCFEGQEEFRRPAEPPVSGSSFCSTVATELWFLAGSSLRRLCFDTGPAGGWEVLGFPRFRFCGRWESPRL